MPRTKKSALSDITKTAIEQADTQSENNGLDPTRTPAGKTNKDEPSEKEVYEAAANVPAEDWKFKLGKSTYKIVELPFLESKIYLHNILPLVEATLKDVAPVINAASSSWFFIKNFTAQNVEDLRQSALDPDTTLAIMRLSFENWGAGNISDMTLQGLKDSAYDPTTFANNLSSVFMQPLLASLKTLSFSDILMKGVDKLPDLVTASFSAYLRKTEKEFEGGPEALKQEIMDKMDIFDMFSVVQAQIQHYRTRSDKIGSFFDQIKAMIGIKNTITAMPTV
jgi:hypothetical protein